MTFEVALARSQVLYAAGLRGTYGYDVNVRGRAEAASFRLGQFHQESAARDALPQNEAGRIANGLGYRQRLDGAARFRAAQAAKENGPR